MEKSIRIRGGIMSFATPKVMGIINVTPDSFYSGSRTPDSDTLFRRVEQCVAEDADIIDIGGYSSRPGASEVSADEEYSRLAAGLEIIRRLAPDKPVSVDTFRANVARRCVEDFSVDIINDIGGGDLDQAMFETVAELGCGYVLMHMRGTPATMQQLTDYDNVTADVLRDLAFKTDRLHALGVADVIIDPGFGFAKTVEQNFMLLRDLREFRLLGCPVLVGISRKTMIWKTLRSTPAEALNGTTVLNTAALLNGADILRVHDVKAAKETVTLTSTLIQNNAI